MMDGLPGALHADGGGNGVAGVEIAGKTRETTGGNFQSHAMSGQEGVGRGGHADREFIHPARLHHDFMVQSLPESGSDNTVTENQGSTVGMDIT